MVPDLLCEKNLKRIGRNWIFESKRSSQLNIFNFSILKTFSFTITYHFSTLQILTTSSWQAEDSATPTTKTTYTTLPFAISKSPTEGTKSVKMEAWPVTDLDKIAKGWKIAMKCSKERLQRVHDLAADELDDAINDGHLVLETVCLFVHACIKHNQYKYAFATCHIHGH